MLVSASRRTGVAVLTNARTNEVGNRSSGPRIPNPRIMGLGHCLSGQLLGLPRARGESDFDVHPGIQGESSEMAQGGKGAPRWL